MDLSTIDLSPDERAEIEAHLAAIAQIEVWKPDADNKPQCLAYESQADVIGFGGAAGGGKSDLGLGKGLTRHRNVQVFRREGPEITSLVDRCAQIVGHRDGLGGKPPVWRNPTPQCEVIEFCSCPNLGDEQKYQGRPKDFLFIDEATNFLELQIRFLMGWLRSVDGFGCQCLMTFNPPMSVEGRWVIAFFGPWLDKKHPNPAKPGELRWFAVNPRGLDVEVPDARHFVWGPDGDRVFDFDPATMSPTKIIRPQSRTFIPSKVTDNKYLMRDGKYVGVLQGLPEPMRSRMLEGDFSAGMEDDPMQVIPTAWVEMAMGRWKRPDRLPPMDAVGVDVAMRGRDNTIIARRHGVFFDEPIVYPGVACPDPATISAYVIAAARNEAVIHIDLFGVGAGPFGFLTAARQQVQGVSMGEKTAGTAVEGRLGFDNLRSELWWRMREALNPMNNTGIALPPNRQLLADLCAPWYEPRGTVICVASRDEIIDKIGRSPDCGTAYILANIDTPKVRAIEALTGGPRKSVEYDPHARYDDFMQRQQGTGRTIGRGYDPFDRIG